MKDNNTTDSKPVGWTITQQTECQWGEENPSGQNASAGEEEYPG